MKVITLLIGIIWLSYQTAPKYDFHIESIQYKAQQTDFSKYNFYPLRYYAYTDSLHSRIFIKDKALISSILNTDKETSVFTTMDLYFREGKYVGLMLLLKMKIIKI